MKISIVIISWNSKGMLERCLEALRPVLARPDVELIRVDNGSTDGSERMPDESVVRLGRNHGVAYARNRGIERAHGKYILLLDDDTEASEEAIAGMERYLDEHPETGICGTALYDAQGALQPSFLPFPGLGVKVRNLLGHGERKELRLPDGPVEPFYIIGACQMIRREVFEKCGLLDEGIFYGPEDADLCLRARKAGWKVTYLPQYGILHHWRHISRRNPFSRISRLHTAALLHFYFKHRRFF